MLRVRSIGEPLQTDCKLSVIQLCLKSCSWLTNWTDPLCWNHPYDCNQFGFNLILELSCINKYWSITFLTRGICLHVADYQQLHIYHDWKCWKIPWPNQNLNILNFLTNFLFLHFLSVIMSNPSSMLNQYF